MVIPKVFEFMIIDNDRVCFINDTVINGGSKDTEVKELTVIP
jgi:hypothetical protein